MRTAASRTLLSALFATLAAAPATLAQAQSPGAPLAAPSGAAAAVRALADEYVAAVGQRFPGVEESLGAARSADRWTDNRPEALRAWEAAEDGFARRIAAIDGGALWGTPEWVTHGALRETLENTRATRVCRTELWGVNHIFGWHLGASRQAAVQRVGTPEHRARALARYEALPAFVDAEVANLREGLRLGYTAHRDAVARVVEQVEGMTPDDVAASSFYSPALRDSSPEFRAAWEAVVRTRVYPALRAYRDFLRDEYLPRARPEAGLGAQPDGAACYRALVRSSTSLDVAPEEMMAMARRARREIEAELAPLARRLVGTGEGSEARRRLKSDLRYFFASRDEQMAALRGHLERTHARLGNVLSRVPETRLELRAAEPFEERSSPPAWYNAAPLDGSRPATFVINLHDSEKKSRMEGLVSASHEGWPGHHLQVAWTQELAAPHPVTRLLSAGGYIEGWGMYAERLALEMGAAGSALDSAGVLVHLADALVALEIDPGMHAFGWTREQAIDTMMTVGGRARAQAEVYADRHAATPSQIVTYMTGYLELMRLRSEARQALGSRFDIREFHDVVLDGGPLPLPMLREKVERWIASKNAGAAPQRRTLRLR
ncbi:MAG TPA: DUF885 domain-containing protein [Longimicrobium sp.]|nr:DUF885 domain-containing protein [Longimicrobium sp.]